VTPYSITAHDSHPEAESALIDRGLGDANDAAAPLDEVRPLSCFARTAAGEVIGGAVGRRWGACCELQQLWVEPAHRRRGIGAQLVHAFEERARAHGCSRFYLETFNFQAPGLYRALGYRVAFALNLYPHGFVKYLMVKQRSDAPAEAAQGERSTLRVATRADVRAIQRVRHSVHENRLTSGVITDDDVIDAMERTGRGWVIEVERRIVGFAVGNAETGNIWALFVEPGHEGRGHGRRLHDAMVDWLWSRGLRRLWLSTEADTRAQRFYEAAGWRNAGPLPGGEILFERHAP
jgi:GNAT superfamily N-acetyltransferase